MSDLDESDERAWAADRRDFVAECRDEIAAERDAGADAREVAADERDQEADEREVTLVEWEQRLDDRAAEMGLPPRRTHDEREGSAARRVQAVMARDEARQVRQLRNAERETAAANRDEATKRREAANPTTQLAMAFAEIARHLYEAESFDEVLTRIVLVAVATVRGCDMASLTVRDDVGYRTVASTHAAATETDHAQYEADQGPCLDAIEEAFVYTPAFPDPRWPALAARPTNSGVESVVSYRVTSTGPFRPGSLAGSLNAYAGRPDAFDTEAQEIGLILAAHASVAAGAVRQRDALEQMSRDLNQALSSRDVIGQAKGILMERLRIPPEDAFDALRRSSQRLNLKLREVAVNLTETGEFDNATGRVEPPRSSRFTQ